MQARPEVLAPAGSREAFFAAIAAGADAIYLAGERFGARAYAANFTVEDLRELMRYAHLRGVKVYVAVNTLLRDDELADAVEFCAEVYRAGADALIVQDMGLVAELNRRYPQICLNASTQMTLHNTAGVKYAEKFGFKRVILAREVSISDIRAICAATEQEVEVFAHGALCICFSGQCLFSSMVGGRSGNRGRCAQPCRLKYQLLKNDEVQGDAHLLSPRDLNTIALLPELAEAGVVSLKIEGRMKRPEYVAAVTSAYAAAAKGEAYDEQALWQAFNRGFTTAYLQDEPGADMMSWERPNNRGVKLGRIAKISREELVLKLDAPLLPGDGLEIWVTRGGRQGFTVPDSAKISRDEAVIPLDGLPVQVQNCRVGDRVFKTLDSRMLLPGELVSAQDDLPLELEFVARLGQKPSLRAKYGDAVAEVAADFAIPLAKNRPADMALLEKQLGRLGGSGWHLADLRAELDEGVMLPASVLNNLRRDAVAALEEKLLADWHRPEMAAVPGNQQKQWKIQKIQEKPNSHKNEKKRGLAKLTVLVDDIDTARAAVAAGADEICWQACAGRWQKPARPDKLAQLGVPVWAELPTVALERELDIWRRRLAEYRAAGLAGVLANNLWAVQLLDELGWGAWRADLGLNCFNAAAADGFAALGAEQVALSRELNGGQLADVARSSAVPTEVQVFGNVELMISRHCPIGAVCGGKTAGRACSGACRAGGFALRDEKGYSFPVYTDEFCRSHIFNGHQLCLIGEVKVLAKSHAALRLDLQHYEPQAAAKIVAIFREGMEGFGGEAAREELARLALDGAGLTRGHHFRGVE